MLRRLSRYVILLKVRAYDIGSDLDLGSFLVGRGVCWPEASGDNCSSRKGSVEGHRRAAAHDEGRRAGRASGGVGRSETQSAAVELGRYSCKVLMLASDRATSTACAQNQR